MPLWQGTTCHASLPYHPILLYRCSNSRVERLHNIPQHEHDRYARPLVPRRFCFFALAQMCALWFTGAFVPFAMLQAAAVLAPGLLNAAEAPTNPRTPGRASIGAASVQVMHSELPCDQEAPTCGATCGKVLLCGQHHCQERCHPGPCPATCRLLVGKSCACGLTQRRMPCSQPLRRAVRGRSAGTLLPLRLHPHPEAAPMQTGGLLASMGTALVAPWLGGKCALAHREG